MSPVSKEFVINPMSALVPNQGHFSSLIEYLDSLKSRLSLIEDEILPDISNLGEDQKRAIYSEVEMLKQIMIWAENDGG